MLKLNNLVISCIFFFFLLKSDLFYILKVKEIFTCSFDINIDVRNDSWD